MTPLDIMENRGSWDIVGLECSPTDPGGSLVPTLPEVPLGHAPPAVSAWFDALAAAARTDNDGSLAAAHDSARAYRSRAKADNTRAAYPSAVRAWCA